MIALLLRLQEVPVMRYKLSPGLHSIYGFNSHQIQMSLPAMMQSKQFISKMSLRLESNNKVLVYLNEIVTAPSTGVSLNSAHPTRTTYSRSERKVKCVSAKDTGNNRMQENCPNFLPNESINHVIGAR